ncbi:MAG: IclR family transcriptional regulator [Micromonosporaceae bacterium]|nr:IclR family transcriptional regulator [Micromonosporaceae bacterium]
MSTEPQARRAAETGASFQPVKSADRTLDVLEALAASVQRPTLGELARRLGIPKSSLHGVLRTLQARGWVRVDETGTRYGLGLRALRVGAAFVETDDAVTLLAPVLDELAARFGETVHLGRLDGAEVVYLAKRESVHPLRLFSAIGRRLPAHATALGKALLAQLDEERLADLLPTPLPRLTSHTLTDLEALRADLAAIRAAGYAVDREENSEGIICVAVAVPAHRVGHPGQREASDAISISLPVSRHSDALQERIAAALLAAVA